MQICRGEDSAKREGWFEDQKPCGRREGHGSIFRGVWRILSAAQKQTFLKLEGATSQTIHNEISPKETN
jgi:hypothetical protein